MRDGISKLTRLLVVIAVVAFGVVGATGGYAEEDDKAHNQQSQEQEQNQSSASQDEEQRSVSEQRQTSGTVVNLFPASATTPPILELDQVGGILTVRVIQQDQIERSGVKVGDYVTVYGLAGGTVSGQFDADLIVVDDDGDNGDGDGDGGDNDGGDNDNNS